MEHYLTRCFYNIKKRCYDKNYKAYPRYGGRGITTTFISSVEFKEWVLEYLGEKPTPLHSIDRIDNDGNYEPGNLRWLSLAESNRNKRIKRTHDRKVCAGEL